MPINDPWLPAPPISSLVRAAAITVYRMTGSPGSYVYETMGNMECLSVAQREGPSPGSATLRYRWGSGVTGAPSDAVQALDTSSPAPKALNAGDRIVVKAQPPGGGTPSIIFDGLAMGFVARFEADGEDAPITCLGIAHRCWDSPIGGALMRPASAPTTTGADVQTDLEAHFNPKGQAYNQASMPNATPLGFNSGVAPSDYPVFLDPYTIATSDQRRKWTLPMAVRYLCFKENAAQTYVNNPSGTTLDAVLVAREPIVGTSFDPTNPATYTASDILVPDKPVTGKDWPSAVQDLIAGRGFGMRWELLTVGGFPQTTLKIYQKQSTTLRDVWLQTRGSILDPNQSNVASASLDRDLAEVANVFVIRGAPLAYECSFILAPGFPMQAADAASQATIVVYRRSGSGDAPAGRDAYRLWVLDEAGQGHYAQGSNTLLTTVADLSTILGSNPGDFVIRRRKPIGRLFTVDASKKPLKYRLAISTDYSGPIGVYAGPWAGTGHWMPITGGYELLEDRVGIRLTCEDPNAWLIGKSTDVNAPLAFRGGVVKAVDCMASSSISNPKFSLRLTCVIEGDKLMSASAPRQTTGSPLQYDVIRHVDARDRYRKDVFAPNSEFNLTGSPVISRDDTTAATAEATSLQAATQAGQLAGTITIPYLTLGYNIGDQIRSIYGRGLGLRTDGGGPSDFPTYPTIIGRRFELSGGQRTILELSDAVDSRIHARSYRSGGGKGSGSGLAPPTANPARIGGA